MRYKEKQWFSELRQNTKYCYYCGCFLHKKNFSTDHRIPKSKGGSNRKENIIICCKFCNELKSDMSEEEFRDLFTVEEIQYLKTLSVKDRRKYLRTKRKNLKKTLNKKLDFDTEI